MNRTTGRLGLEALVERPQKQRINPDQPASVLSLHERHSDLDARPYTNPRCHGVLISERNRMSDSALRENFSKRPGCVRVPRARMPANHAQRTLSDSALR